MDVIRLQVMLENLVLIRSDLKNGENDEKSDVDDGDLENDGDGRY